MALHEKIFSRRVKWSILIFQEEAGEKIIGTDGTKIKLSIASDNHVILNVFDALEKKVVELLNENKKAGSYNINFDAPGLSSGLYFYRIISGGFTSTKKMVLLR